MNKNRIEGAVEQGMVELGRQGIVLAGEDYDARTQFVFTHLNELKPAMVDEATRNAREVAKKFARDSDSRPGKIRRASQGLFSIQDRDSTTTTVSQNNNCPAKTPPLAESRRTC